MPLFARLTADRAGPCLRTDCGPKDYRRHERGRNVPDDTGNPLRGGHRPGPHIPIQSAFTHHRSAGRSDIPQQRGSAQGPLRTGGKRCLHPALRRGGLPVPAAVHPTGDPAFEPGGSHPAHDRFAVGRHVDVSVYRSAGTEEHHRRYRSAARDRCDRKEKIDPDRQADDGGSKTAHRIERSGNIPHCIRQAGFDPPPGSFVRTDRTGRTDGPIACRPAVWREC